jgi:hypothetical protein
MTAPPPAADGSRRTAPRASTATLGCLADDLLVAYGIDLEQLFDVVDSFVHVMHACRPQVRCRDDAKGATYHAQRLKRRVVFTVHRQQPTARGVDGDGAAACRRHVHDEQREEKCAHAVRRSRLPSPSADKGEHGRR